MDIENKSFYSVSVHWDKTLIKSYMSPYLLFLFILGYRSLFGA